MDYDTDHDGDGLGGWAALACAVLLMAHRDAALSSPPSTAWPWKRWTPRADLGRFWKSGWFANLVDAAGLEVDTEHARQVLSRPPAGGTARP